MTDSFAERVKHAQKISLGEKDTIKLFWNQLCLFHVNVKYTHTPHSKNNYVVNKVLKSAHFLFNQTATLKSTCIGRPVNVLNQSLELYIAAACGSRADPFRAFFIFKGSSLVSSFYLFQPFLCPCHKLDQAEKNPAFRNKVLIKLLKMMF